MSAILVLCLMTMYSLYTLCISSCLLLLRNKRDITSKTNVFKALMESIQLEIKNLLGQKSEVPRIPKPPQELQENNTQQSTTGKLYADYVGKEICMKVEGNVASRTYDLNSCSQIQKIFVQKFPIDEYTYGKVKRFDDMDMGDYEWSINKEGLRSKRLAWISDGFALKYNGKYAKTKTEDRYDKLEEKTRLEFSASNLSEADIFRQLGNGVYEVINKYRRSDSWEGLKDDTRSCLYLSKDPVIYRRGSRGQWGYTTDALDTIKASCTRSWRFS